MRFRIRITETAKPEMRGLDERVVAIDTTDDHIDEQIGPLIEKLARLRAVDDG